MALQLGVVWLCRINSRSLIAPIISLFCYNSFRLEINLCLILPIMNFLLY